MSKQLQTDRTPKRSTRGSAYTNMYSNNGAAIVEGLNMEENQSNIKVDKLGKRLLPS